MGITKGRVCNLFAIQCTAILATISLSLMSSASAQPSATLEFKRCSVVVQSIEIDAECATFKRHENPSDTNSKLLELSVIKLPSHSSEPTPDAFTLIQGGPGGSSIDLAVTYNHVLDKIRRKRDIIVIDQRGTGRSNLLTCDIDDLSSQLDLAYTKKLSKECAEKLSVKNDLRFYTTSIAVDDLEALRIAAGYSHFNLYGVSYGTRVVQHYLRKYPSSARSAVIDGVVQVGLNLAGAEIARRWEDSFESINKRCQNDNDCNSSHGNLRTTYNALQDRFKAEPVKVNLPHPTTGLETDYTFNENSLFIAMRLMAYSTEGSALIPLLLSEALKGNYRFAASQIIILESIFQDQFAIGMHNSVMCAEDAPFVTKQDQARAKGTIATELMSQSLLATCDAWPQGVLDDQFHQPFNSDIPTLILSGETDPITPPANGEIASNMFSNSKHIVVPAHGHGVMARGCVPNLVNLFINTASFEGVDETCTERENHMPTFNTLTGPRP